MTTLPILARVLTLWMLLVALAACGGFGAEDTPQAAFKRWQAATEARDVAAYFEEVVPPNQEAFLLNWVMSWRARDWPAPEHAALERVLKAHSIDTLSTVYKFDDRQRIDALESLPAVLAELFAAVDNVGPQGIPLWDLLPQPVSLAEVGAVDNYNSAEATMTFKAFDPTTRRSVERTDAARFFRDEEGRWRVSSTGF
jgi:hypothetical protein